MSISVFNTVVRLEIFYRFREKSYSTTLKPASDIDTATKILNRIMHDFPSDSLNTLQKSNKRDVNTMVETHALVGYKRT